MDADTQESHTEVAPSIGWVAVVVGAGVIAAWLIPGVRPGIGLCIAAAVMVTSVGLAGDGLGTDDYVYWGLALTLVASAVFLAAEWVITLNLMAAAGLVMVHATRAQAWRTIFLAPFRLAVSILSGLATLAQPIAQKSAGSKAELGPVARGAVLGSVLVLIFGALFVSADAAFSDLLQRALLPDWDLQLLPFRIFVAAFTIIAIATVVAAQRREWDQTTLWDRGTGVAPGRWKVVEWALPLTMLDVLFLGFVAVQITVLFGGRELVLQTAGLTYAEYARQGFFQLLAVAALTLAVAGAAVFLGNPRAERERTVMRVLLGALSVMTLVILASAFKRLSLYEATYGFTRLRLTVDAAIVWIAALFGFLIVAGIRWKASWMPRATVLLTAGTFLIFSLINPDRFIARENIERFERTGKLDVGYLGILSEDALPVLLQLPADERACVLSMVGHYRGLGQDEPWNAWNLSRARARDLIDTAAIQSLSSTKRRKYLGSVEESERKRC